MTTTRLKPLKINLKLNSVNGGGFFLTLLCVDVFVQNLVLLLKAGILKKIFEGKISDCMLFMHSIYNGVCGGIVYFLNDFHQPMLFSTL